LANRPTLRAFELAYAAAIAFGDFNRGSDVLARGRSRWGQTKTFAFSTLSNLGAVACDGRPIEVGQ
jgi:hypothetical protein